MKLLQVIFSIAAIMSWVSGPLYAETTSKDMTPSVANKPLKKVQVVLTQFVSHKALNDVRDGAVEIIEDCTKDEFDVQFQFSNASGNVLVARQIALTHSSQNPDVIVAISTLSAQSVIRAARGQIPVVFGAVTDPKVAQIVGDNVTGVTDRPPFKQQVAFLKEMMPDLTSVAILYNPGEDNSRAALAALKGVFAEANIDLVAIGVTKAVEIKQAVHKAKGTSQAIFIANDNLIASGFESLIIAAQQDQIPVFASDVMLVHRGAVAMRGIDYFQSGQQVGLQVCSILKGVAPKDVPTKKPADLKLIVNEQAAREFGVTIPDLIKEEADVVIPLIGEHSRHQLQAQEPQEPQDSQESESSEEAASKKAS